MLRNLKNKYHYLQFKLSNILNLYPSKNLTLIGVTGTDGKTTTVSLIYHILKYSGIKVGMISTVEIKFLDHVIDSGLHVTTPDAKLIPKYLKQMKKAGVTHVVIEATSNGLDQNRLGNSKFDSVVITNIKEDHLDYHKTWENYAKAKFKLLKMVKNKGFACLNRFDIKSAKWLQKQSAKLKQTIYVRWIDDRVIKDRNRSIDGISFKLDNVYYKIPILGEHNFENVSQAIFLCKNYTDEDRIKEALLHFNPPTGRMQIMQSRPFAVIVDFAHTPHALESALKSLNSIKPDPNTRIIAVFGCAGQRDKTRRRMGEVSAKYADITVLTSEDPRDEEVGLINNEILKYAEKQKAVLIERFATRKLYRNSDLKEIVEKINFILKNQEKPFIAFDENTPRSREDAIDFALSIARPGDIVFITGKGHEKSLAFGDPVKEFDWSDQKVVKKKLKAMVKEA